MGTLTNTYEAKNILGLIVKAFKTGDLPKAIKLSYIEDPDPTKPMKKYSLHNKLLIHLQGTQDARGSNQWKLVKREVDYSRHPYKVHILRPVFSNACRECSQNSFWGKILTRQGTAYFCKSCNRTFQKEDKANIKQILTGFTTVYLYKVEDTKGEPLPTFKPKKLPCLSEVGEKWGIKLAYDGTNHGEYGYTDGKNKIVLCTEDEGVYAHELMHVADSRNNYNLIYSQVLTQTV